MADVGTTVPGRHNVVAGGDAYTVLSFARSMRRDNVSVWVPALKSSSRAGPARRWATRAHHRICSGGGDHRSVLLISPGSVDNLCCLTYRRSAASARGSRAAGPATDGDCQLQRPVRQPLSRTQVGRSEKRSWRGPIVAMTRFGRHLPPSSSQVGMANVGTTVSGRHNVVAGGDAYTVLSFARSMPRDNVSVWVAARKSRSSAAPALR